MSCVLMMSINLNDSAILTINEGNYCCNINWISKSEAVNLLQRAYLTKKVEHYKLNFFFIVYIKDGWRNHNVWWYKNKKT